MKLDKPLLYKNLFNVFEDERGYLNASSFRNLLNQIQQDEFKIAYQLLSKTNKKYTFRGFHFQIEPYNQKKVIFVHSGQIKDYVFPYDAPNRENIVSFNLEPGDVLLVPDTYAHGFLTLSDDVIVQYLMDKDFNESSYKGINGYNFVKEDLGIKDVIISKKDRGYQTKL